MPLEPHATATPQQPVVCQRVALPDGETTVYPGQGQVDICIIAEGSTIHEAVMPGAAVIPNLGDARRIGPGAVVIAGPGRGHAFEQPRDCTLYAVSFLADWLMDDLRASWGQQDALPPFWAAIIFRRSHAMRSPRFALPPDALRAVQRELNDLIAAGNEPNPPRLYLKATLLKVMALLDAAHAREPQVRESQAGDAAAVFSLPVTRVLDDIEQSLAEGHPFRVAEAADSAAMTSDHLSRLFRDAIGESPRAYYQRRRAQAAARLLLDPAHSIADIAGQLGYCDAAHFCNTFKRVLGVSPSAYRKHFHGG